MYSESRLLLAHEYERLALVWRLAEMLVAGVGELRDSNRRLQIAPPGSAGE